MGKVFGREPALFFSLFAAILGLIVAFGLSLSAEQLAAIYTAEFAIVGFAIRSKVSPTP